jgi:flagellar M-ring protein FliF
VPGVQSNLAKSPVPPPASGGGSKNDETKNYEISRTESRIVAPAGSLTKISVAVLVDGKYEKAAGKKKGGTQPKYVPRSTEELQKIEALVKSAVGFDAARGDQVTVANIPFQDVAAESEMPGAPWWEAPILMALVKNLLIGISFLALIFLVVRPMLKSLRMQRPGGSTTFEGINEGQAAFGESAMPAQLAMSKVNQLELVEAVKKDPYQTAQVLQSWLKQNEH